MMFSAKRIDIKAILVKGLDGSCASAWSKLRTDMTKLLFASHF